MSSKKHYFILMIFCAIWYLFSFQGICCGQWTGQGVVNYADTSISFSSRIAIDSLGYPWAVWVNADTCGGPENICFSRWNGTNWEPQGYVSEPDSGHEFKPTIAIDSQNTPWVIWNRDMFAGPDLCNIFFSRWNGSGWDPREQVNQPNSRYDYSPRMAIGGGQIWVVWYAGFEPPAPYQVFASHWNGSGWDPDVQVSPPDTNHNWFAKVAVDKQGNPHVVYSGYWTCAIYYTTYNGTTWTEPMQVNDPEVDHGYDPSIAIDDSGYINVVWTGYPPPPNPIVDTDIYYSRYDGNNWSQDIMVNRDDSLRDWVARIAVSSPQNIWVVWWEERSLWETDVYYTHFDGQSWSKEERLNNDDYETNASPELALDPNGNLWVVWCGFDTSCTEVGFTPIKVVYNMYKATGVDHDEYPPILPRGFSLFQNYPNPFNSATAISYQLSEVRPHRTTLKIYNIAGQEVRTLVDHSRQGRGEYKVIWNGKDDRGRDVASGVYFYRLEVKGNRGRFAESKKMLLLR